MTTINGLPAHVLLVHLVVVLLPLVSAFAVLGSVWPAAQRKFTFLTPAGALVGLIAVPLTTRAGTALFEQLGSPASVERHMMLGGMVLPWAIALFVTTSLQWAYFQFVPSRRWLTVVLALLVVASAIGTAVVVALTGEAGARSAWGGIGS